MILFFLEAWWRFCSTRLAFRCCICRWNRSEWRDTIQPRRLEVIRRKQWRLLSISSSVYIYEIDFKPESLFFLINNPKIINHKSPFIFISSINEKQKNKPVEIVNKLIKYHFLKELFLILWWRVINQLILQIYSA